MTLHGFSQGWGLVRCRRCGADIPIEDAVALFDEDDKLNGWQCAGVCDE